MELGLKFRMDRTAVGAMVIAAVTLTATAGNVYAADTPPDINWDHVYSASGVRVYVEEHGDIISVCDTWKNGHSAHVTVSDGTWPENYEMTANGGYGSCKTHRASDGRKYNLDETGVDLFYYGIEYDDYAYEEAYFVNDH
ncbi:hypothetical protein ACFZAV_40035 [Streptomyces sp. NPDC008343]|uniref:hypothetical protein n=1 Tax=Streptomyces sp. NPDC008343 TaxID=3364828 RepID=UPI0036E0FFD9